MTRATPQLYALGDSAITISLAGISSRAETERARATAQLLRAAQIPHVEEIVPAYTAVTVFYDALHISFRQLSEKIENALASRQILGPGTLESRHHSIRVRYDGADLDAVAAATGLSPLEVVAIHSAETYSVDLLGFVPGFAYLSEIDARLELPRREQPRPRVPAGSVAIAARLTGIYPFDTPGGWHILGSTNEVLFDPRRDEPSLFRPGDTVKFEPLI
jgi:KipI family sensor histidine kinase inhibitor